MVILRTYAKKPAQLPPPTLLTRQTVAHPGDDAALKAAVAKAPGDATALTKLADHYAADRVVPAGDRHLSQGGRRSIPTMRPAWSGMGEAYVQTIPSTQAALPPQARDAFMHAVAINGNDLRSRFYLAMEKDFLGPS